MKKIGMKLLLAIFLLMLLVFSLHFAETDVYFAFVLSHVACYFIDRMREQDDKHHLPIIMAFALIFMVSVYHKVILSMGIAAILFLFILATYSHYNITKINIHMSFNAAICMTLDRVSVIALLSAVIFFAASLYALVKLLISDHRGDRKSRLVYLCFITFSLIGNLAYGFTYIQHSFPGVIIPGAYSQSILLNSISFATAFVLKGECPLGTASVLGSMMSIAAPIISSFVLVVFFACFLTDSSTSIPKGWKKQ